LTICKTKVMPPNPNANTNPNHNVNYATSTPLQLATLKIALQPSKCQCGKH